ncbi:MAG: patatin-like phospholipase family protein [Saprospiraceae bacterium]|nr:patatin-like phospholipase family protein [Saprospiraceae bacterium]
METSAYTQHPEVQALLTELHTVARERPGGLRVSDIRDAAGRQYVDLVMEGGGTLGVALLGYIYVLEQLNIRFLNLAGTSAGSIVSMLLAVGPIEEEKSDWLIEAVAGKDFYDFVDGNKEVRKFIDALLDPEARKAKKVRLTAKVLDDIRDYYGLCPGLHFHDWLSGLLAAKGVRTLADLQAQRRAVPTGIQVAGTGVAIAPARWARLSIVSADISTGTKVSLPDMAHLYYAEPDQANPADFVRASMSVPVFFYPCILKNIPKSESASANWAQAANYRGPVPPEVYLVDGGSMSNFPISFFYAPEKTVDAPVFGIKIGADRDSFTAMDSFGAFAGAMLGAMMSFSDNDFFVQHPDWNRFVGVIDSGTYNWLDFHLSDEGKLDLFVRGARAARDFLLGFDWPGAQHSISKPS